MRTVKKIPLYVLTALLLLWGLVWLVSPPAVRWVADDLLQQYNLRLSQDSSVRVNLLLLKVSVNDLEMLQGDDVVLSIDKLIADVAFWPLLGKHIRMQRLDIDGFKTQVKKIGNRLSVAGIEIPDTATTEQRSEDAEEPENNSSTFAITIPAIHLTRSNVAIDYEGKVHNVRLRDITVTNLDMNADNLGARTNLKLGLDDAMLDADLSFSKKGETIALEAKTQLEELKLEDTRDFVENLPDYSGLASVKLNTNILVEGDAIGVKLTDSELSLKQLQYSDDRYTASIGDAHLDLNDLNATLNTETLENAQAKLDLVLDGINVQPVNDNVVLAAVDKINLTGIVLSRTGDANHFSIDQLRLDKLIASHNNRPGQEGEVEPLLTLQQFSINEIEGDDHEVGLKEVLINQPVAHVEIAEDGAVRNLVEINLGDDSEDGESAKGQPQPSLGGESEKDNGAYQFAIDKVQLVKSGQLHFVDESISPAFKKTLEFDRLEISDIDSANHQHALHFTVGAKDSEFLTVNVTGEARPFGELVNLNLEGEIKEFPLPQASAYTSKYIGFGVEKGQLNTDLQIAVVDSVIDGKTVLYINAAEFDSTDTVDDLSVVKQGSVPLNVALNMIKDGDGNIKLVVPLSGNVDDPNFGVQYIVGLIIEKAALSQAKSYLLNTFVPYAKVVSVAMAAGSYALKVRFEDLPYQPGVVDVAPDQQEYVQQLIALLRDDEDLIVHVCPTAAITEPANTDSQTSGNVDRKQALLDLANTRANNFKRTVVEQGGVESSRLLVCAPEVDVRDDAIPKISLTSG